MNKSIQKIIFENLTNNLILKISKRKNSFEIKAFSGSVVAGRIAVELIPDGYYIFDGKIDKETFDELFPNGNFTKINMLNISDNFKGKGVGKMLMISAMNEIKKHGFDRIFLDATPIGNSGLNQDSLVKFYESFGFESFLKINDGVYMLNKNF